MDNFSWDSNFLPPQPPENSSSSSHYSCRRAISDEDTFTTVASSSPKRRAGRKKFNETRHPVYKGVRRRNGDKWVCEVREPKKKSRIWLGTFPTPEMAARAHDVAAIALRGRSACLNFADSAWLLPVPSSTNARDIQKAAAEAAEAFRPSGTASVQTSEPHPPEKVFYMEEESDLGMPTILANMAEGSLLSPPRLDSWTASYWDDVERESDVSLWSYSI